MPVPLGGQGAFQPGVPPLLSASFAGEVTGPAASRPLESGARSNTSQCRYSPVGASGSVTASAVDVAPLGTPVQLTTGRLPAPRQVYSSGMVAPSVNASTLTRMDELGATDGVGTVGTEVAAVLFDAFDEPEPQPARSRAAVSINGVVGLMPRIVPACPSQLNPPGWAGHRSFGRYAGKPPRADGEIPYNKGIQGSSGSRGRHMDVRELRRAYATLGLDDDATLAQARDAYLIWAALLSETATEQNHDAGNSAAARAVSADLCHHELDLAWHAIEQAHEHGVLFPRRARGCRQCTATPAVRVSLHSVAPGGLRARSTVHNALLCRTCGLATYQRVQRETLRRGWWGVLAPFANLRAITRNHTEKVFLRRLEPSVPRQHRRAARLTQRAEGAENYGGWAGNRMAAWLTALAAIALIVGIVLPTGNAPEQPTPHGSVAASTVTTPQK